MYLDKKLEKWTDIFLGSGIFKKSGTLLFAKSRVQKKRVIVIQKEIRQTSTKVRRPSLIIS
jgi:hypothetical protein